MDKSVLREIALEQRELCAGIATGVRREKLDEIKRQAALPHTIVISGIRRSGKSTLMAQVMKELYRPEEFYYFNFEDERLLDFKTADFNSLYEVLIELFGERRVFFLDEIQNVEHWELFVRRMQERGFKFYITGSNASLLSKELGTKLTGRTIPVELSPFSFREFLELEQFKLTRTPPLKASERSMLKKHFNSYLETGGMPEYLRYKEPIVLKRVYEDILYRDIVARHEIREIKALRELGLYFLSTTGNLFSYNKLRSILGLGSVNSVKSYTEHFEDSFLFFTVSRYSPSLKQQILSPRKVYCIDNGLNNAISFRFSKDRGCFLENLVFLELRRRGFEIYYYKTSSNLEVDFLTKRGTKVIAPIQVTLSLAEEKTRLRELKSLNAALDELGLEKGLILTEDGEEDIESGGHEIAVRPVYQWLLEGA